MYTYKYTGAVPEKVVWRDTPKHRIFCCFAVTVSRIVTSEGAGVHVTSSAFPLSQLHFFKDKGKNKFQRTQGARAYTRALADTRAHIRTHTYMYTPSHTYPYALTYTHTCAYTHTRTHTCAPTCKHTRISTHTCAHTHAHTHVDRGDDVTGQDLAEERGDAVGKAPDSLSLKRTRFHIKSCVESYVSLFIMCVLVKGMNDCLAMELAIFTQII